MITEFLDFFRMNFNKKNPMNDALPAGFTLFEVMIAIAFISIVLTAVYRLQAQTIAMAAASRFYTTAPLLAQGKMAEFELKKADELESASGDFGEEFPGFAWEVSVEDVESEELGSLAERLKRIDVRVSFDEAEFNYGFRAYRFIFD